jgi:hypothetical protein
MVLQKPSLTLAALALAAISASAAIAFSFILHVTRVSLVGAAVTMVVLVSAFVARGIVRLVPVFADE